MTGPTPADRFTWRFRLLACSLVLVALAFSQRPGRLVGDTKLDLVVDPAALLARSLHLWDPEGGFGQVQNQAYGYLFPMGPFFWLGDLLTLPGWVVQRLWWSLLLVVAFLGVVKLCGALGLGSPASRVLAGFAYALSPRILTVLGPISIEAWPSALAPWVLLPLVIGAGRGSPRRAALLSALAVGAVGGVNAAATFAVIPLGAVWLLTRTPGPRRRALMLWWPTLVLAATAWWLVPLFLLGRYSPPFLDYIETASVTTFPTTLFDALRGTSHWVPYVDSTWQAGNDLLTTSYVALNSGALLLFGIVGLTVRRNPHRQFLVLSLLLGLVMVTAGHGGELAGWFAEAERASLDGLLAPLRNVHKFDPVIRLPLVLGLAHLLGVLAARARAAVRERASRDALGDRLAYLGVLVVAIASVAGIAGPAFAGRLGAANDFAAVPDQWSATAEWLEANGQGSTALLVPGSSFGYFTWGDPDDEPLQPLAQSPWAVRNAVPLAPAGNIRMLDAIEEQLASGRRSAGLAAYLARAGIGHLVVRNDLRTPESTSPVVVHQTLERSPGIRKVAAFGPYVGSRARVRVDGEPVIVDRGWTNRYRAVEIYAVDGAHRAVTATASPLVVGGPEDLLDLLDTGLIGEAPATLAVDAPQGARPGDGGLLLTDGLRRQERTFARILDATSPTLTPDDDGRRGAPARDYTLGDGRWETQARLLGARALTATSSRADANGSGPVTPERLPFAAFDGLTQTWWESEPEDRQPAISVELATPVAARSVEVVLGDTGRRVPERIRVVTDNGSSAPVEAEADRPVRVRVPAGETSTVTVVRDRPGAGALGVAEVRIDGVDVDRTLVLPAVPAAWGAPDAIVLSATSGWRAGCVEVEGDVRCVPGRARVGEEPGALDRTVRLGAGGSYRVTAQVTPTDGAALQGLIQQGQLINARTSSDAVDEALASAVAAIDGDPGTTWIADGDDRDPVLSLDWLGERTVRGLELRLDRDAAASRPTRVVLEYAGGRQTVDLDASGRAQVRPFRATRVDLHLRTDEPTEELDADGEREPLPVGVSEARLPGVDLLPIALSDQLREVGCEFGPTVRIGSELFRTSVTASPRALMDGGLLDARLCGPERVEVRAGETRAVLSPAPAFRGLRMILTGDEPAPGEDAPATPATLSEGSPVARRLTPEAPDAAIAAVRENQNAGWSATAEGGGETTAVTVDGWQQGWLLEGEVTELELRYGPDRTYRLALGAGALLLVALLAAALPRRSRRAGHDEPPPAGPRPVPAAVVAGLGLGACGVVAGWWGLALGLVAAGLATVAVPRWVSSETAAWVSGLLCAAAAPFYWWRPLGSADGWAGTMLAPQLLVLAGLGLLIGLVLDAGPPTRWRSRIAGRSTQR